MHSFLKSIGFSQYTTKKMSDLLVKEAIGTPTDKFKVNTSSGTMVQINKEFGKDFGITVIGEIDQLGFLNVEHFFPYLNGSNLSTQDEILMQKHADKTSFAGISEDMNLGTSLIFYLQNISDFLDCIEKQPTFSPTNVFLTGLASDGTILFEIAKNEEQVRFENEGKKQRHRLIQAAKQGDNEAIDSLTLEDIDTYTLVRRRAIHEDVFSIVDSFFMPYGVETDHYHILGTIITCEHQVNPSTLEVVYIMDVLVNDLAITICINSSDLLGEPVVGRRFKGTIWLQGKVLF